MLVVTMICAVLAADAVTTAEPAPELLEPREGLENLLKLTPRLYSGGEPQGAHAFQALAELGIQTVISVDAARPDVDAARAHGLRYVHIPIGYDGIAPEEAAAMKKALAECEPPIYIHCHHGKHRSPAMAAIALRIDTSCSAEDARAVLELAGTGKEYDGLWRDVREFDEAAIDTMDATLHEVAPVGDMEAEMAAIDRIWDRLKICQKAQWTTPEDHPDVSPAHEALMLEERLREFLRHEATPKGMAPGFEAAHAAAAGVRAALTAGRLEEVEKHFAVLGQSCKQCHSQYRD